MGQLRSSGKQKGDSEAEREISLQRLHSLHPTRRLSLDLDERAVVQLERQVDAHRQESAESGSSIAKSLMLRLQPQRHARREADDSAADRHRPIDPLHFRTGKVTLVVSVVVQHDEELVCSAAKKHVCVYRVTECGEEMGRRDVEHEVLCLEVIDVQEIGVE